MKKGLHALGGLVRPKAFQLMTTNDQREWIFRKSLKMRLEDPEGNHSQINIVHRRVFLPGWLEELNQMREEQKGMDIKMEFKDRPRQ